MSTETFDFVKSTFSIDAVKVDCPILGYYKIDAEQTKDCLVIGLNPKVRTKYIVIEVNDEEVIE